ncbi:MAG: NAD(P)H-binding protein [Solirubrobacteraceae bacterium]
MNILLTGVSGYLGARLAPRLLADGHAVRGLARNPGRVSLPLPVTAGDVVSGAGLAEALQRIDLAYYLIHSMEPSVGARFDAREAAAAENFGAAARSARVKRIVYLGGILPADGPVSTHLSSRLAVEEILLDAVPGSVAFRSSIVIGARSRSFRFLVRLIERLPVLAVPAWRVHSTAPVDERDVIEVLARAATSTQLAGCSLDIAGPEIVTYGELIERIVDNMLLRRPIVGFRRLTATPIASRVSAVIAGEDHALIGPLMDSLATDLVPRDDRVTQILAIRRHSLNAAIERALRDWELVEPLAAR